MQAGSPTESSERPAAIVVLGAPNEADGALSDRARERADQALAEYKGRRDHRLLLTGGWGAHFNTSPYPHAHHVQRYLLERGVPLGAFLEFAESANTPEDARLCAPIVRRHGLKALRIVTSDFHVPRAAFCFTRVFPGMPLIFRPSTTRAAEEELRRLRDHETRALARLRESFTP